MNNIDNKNEFQFSLNLVVTNRASRDIQDIATAGSRRQSIYDFDEEELRDKAKSWLDDYLEKDEIYKVYVFNDSREKNQGVVVDIRFATDTNNPGNQKLIEKLNGKTLLLVGTEEKDNHFSVPVFKIINVILKESSTGSFDQLYSLRANIQFRSSGKNIGFPKLFYEKLIKLPKIEENKKIVERRLENWKSYLAILLKENEERKFEVRFTHYRKNQSENQIIFNLDRKQENIPWERIKRAKGDFINIRTSYKNWKSNYSNYQDYFEEEDDDDGLRLGALKDIWQNYNQIYVDLDEDLLEEINSGRRNIPKSGILSYNASGGEIFIDRMNKGIQSLSRRQSVNVNLSEFLFDVNEANQINQTKWISLQKNQLLQSKIFENKQQLRAVEGSLITPDIFLIQGPPGTGKTTVIAEICYQIAMNGGRTMIASQANLAVDNAMSKLVHNPVIRALRRGKAERVEEEGQPFLEKNVITTWLQQTGSNCRKNLNELKEEIQTLKPSIEFKDSINRVINEILQYSIENKSLGSKQQVLYESISNLEEELTQIENQMLSIDKFLGYLEILENSTSKDGFAELSFLEELELGISTFLNFQNQKSLMDFASEIKAVVAEINKWSDCLDFNEKDFFNLSLIKQIQFLTTLENAYKKIYSQYWHERSLIDQIYLVIIECFNLYNKLIDQKRRSNFLLDQSKLLETFEKYSVHNSEFYKNEFKHDQSTNASEQAKYISKTNEILSKLEYLKKSNQAKSNELSNLITELDENLKHKKDQILIILEKISRLSQFKQIKEDITWIITNDFENLNFWCENWRKLIVNVDDNFLKLSGYFKTNRSFHYLSIIKNILLNIKYEGDSTYTSKRNLLDFENTQLRKMNEDNEKPDSKNQLLLETWKKVIAKSPPEFEKYKLDQFLYKPDLVRNFLIDSKKWERELLLKQDELLRREKIVNDWINRIEENRNFDIQGLKQIYINNANVIGITCGQSGAKHFSDEYRDFDCVIVDEVSKATPPELILPMLKGKKIILVGDHKQLPPMIGPDTLSELSKQYEMTDLEIDQIKKSLFKELFNKCPKNLKTTLTTQYRMHPQIMQAINQFYNEELECGITNPDKERAHYLEPIISSKNHLLWIDTPRDNLNKDDEDGTTFFNEQELKIIEKVVNLINNAWEPHVLAGAKPKEIGIITFYSSQNSKIHERLLNRKIGEEFRNLSIRIGTVDRFQGMEKPVIIASLVRNNEKKEIGFAKEPERINVAFSRAQELLIIIGCSKMFCNNSFHKLASDFYSFVYKIAKVNDGVQDPFKYLTIDTERLTQENNIEKSEKIVNSSNDQLIMNDISPQSILVKDLDARLKTIQKSLESSVIINDGYQLLVDVITLFDPNKKNLTPNEMINFVKTRAKVLGNSEIIIKQELKYNIFSLRDRYIRQNYEPTVGQLDNYIRSLIKIIKSFGFNVPDEK